jgi:hypothetical protein
LFQVVAGVLLYNLKSGKIMAKLLDLVESHPDVIVSIRAADLLTANEELIRRTRQELEQLITDANTELLETIKDALFYDAERIANIQKEVRELDELVKNPTHL